MSTELSPELSADVMPPEGRGSDGPPASFAETTLRLLFPGDGTAAPGSPSFLAIPRGPEPRYLVPRRPGGAAAEMVGRQLLGGRARTRVARTVIMLALRSGLAGALWPSRIAVARSAGTESVLDWAAARLGGPDVLVAVSVGRPRANRKPVLQVTDHRGRLLAFAKVGHNELTRRLVRDEGVALEALRSASLRTVQVPALLAQEPWNGLELLLMSPLPIPGGAVAGTLDRAALNRAVLEIAQVGGVTSRPWGGHLFGARLRSGVEDLGARAAGLHAALARLESQAPTLAYGSWHGDLNPGNLAVVGDRMLVWDWERFESGVPVGFDVLHHDFQEAVTVRSQDPQAACRRILGQAPELLAPLGVDAGLAPSVALAYFLWLAVRFLSDRQAEAGASLGDIDRWLVPVVGAIDLDEEVR